MSKPKLNTRANGYQWYYHEIYYDFTDPLTSSIWDNERVLHNQYSQKFLELNDQALARILELAKENCTEHQNAVMEQLLMGKTQMEVAEALGCNQSSIVKTLKGNEWGYGSSEPIRKHGGVGKRLVGLILHDDKLKSILKEIQMLMDNML